MTDMNKRVKVYMPGSKHEMSLSQLCKASGFKGITEEEMAERLVGDHCACGTNNGEFTLLPLDSVEVRDGGKRYMICRKCGCYSHL